MKKLKEKQRDKSIQIRLTQEELNALQEAKGSKGTLARYAREKLLSDTSHTERQKTVSHYTDLIFQLKKIGTNINQIAYQLNSGELNKVPAIIEFKKELTRIRELADEKVNGVLK